MTPTKPNNNFYEKQKEIDNNHINPNKIFKENNYTNLSKRKELIKNLKAQKINLFSNKYRGTTEQNYILAFAIKNNKGNNNLSEWKINETIKEYSPYIKGKLNLLKGDIDHFKYSDYKKGLEIITMLEDLNKDFFTNFLEKLKGKEGKTFISQINKIKTVKDAEQTFGILHQEKQKIIKKLQNKGIKDSLIQNIIKSFDKLIISLIKDLQKETDNNEFTKREIIGIFGKFLKQVNLKIKNMIEKEKNL